MPATKTRILTRNNRHTAYYAAPDGQWIGCGTYSDKAVAKVKAQQGYDNARTSSWINPKGSRTSLARYAEDIWIPSLVVEAKTKVSYLSTYNNHVRPVFGNCELGQILYTEIKTWLTAMEEAGTGRCVQRQAFVVFNLILRSAHRDRLIPNLPTVGIKLRPIPKPVPLIFSPEQFTAFLAEVPEYWKPLITVGVDTGMRASELRGLRPEQINWGRQKIRVDRATVQLSGRHELGRFLDKAYPKGARPRNIKVSESTLRTLASIMKARGMGGDSTERVFVSPNGDAFGAEPLLEIFHKGCVAAGVPARTFKHLRSTCASWMLDGGASLLEVKDHLGHATVATTEKYLGLAEETDEDDNVISFEDYLEDSA